MIWLTWRQFRAQSWVALAALAAVAVTLVVTGPHLAHLYNVSGIATCQATGDCGSLTTRFLAELSGSYQVLYYLGLGILLFVPVIIGASGGRRWSPASSRPAPTGWPGTSPSPGPTGWRSSSVSSGWPAWRPPDCSASC